MPPQLISARAVATRLGLSLQSVHALCATGRIKASLICNRYRIDPASLDEFIEAQTIRVGGN